LELTPGDAYYFRNPTAEVITQLFVGEVPQGTLVNPLPAGLSAKASIVPQSGGLTSLFLVPGEEGDEASLYVNDGMGGGTILTSVFSGARNTWEPDYVVQVGEGFWIRKRRATDWVRVFWVN
jgi:hypothetical protein